MNAATDAAAVATIDSPETVAAVIVTYRRPDPLARLLESLSGSTHRPSLTVVVDNHGDDPATRAVLDRVPFDLRYVPNPGNPGPGAGWKTGMQAALELVPPPGHLLLLDDDVVLPPDAIAALLAAARIPDPAGAVAPLLCDAEGRLWGFPEPTDPALQKAIRAARTPLDCLDRIGPGPHPFAWCTGACVLVAREAVEACGFPRTDFRMLGEDLEYSMRIAAHLPARFAPTIVVPHLPPEPPDPQTARRGDATKFLCLLQNLSYLAFHSPYSRHLRRYLAGNFRRWFNTHGWNHAGIAAALAAFRLGALRGEPAGLPDGEALRARYASRR